ncbi:MAG: V-type ATP synthase subunit D [Firmicutes bacterium]|jgi:V/A-type H+-transporting ATPase subunit D|nr:V-type ATP synthase subunit D [Bacillota bacterium]
MEVRVSPTRMQLLRLKKRLAMATRGHKLLKDKLDELLRHFLELIRRNKELREEVDRALGEAFSAFLVARGAMSEASVEGALMYPKESISITASKKNIMNVQVPHFQWSFRGQEDRTDIYPYGFAYTSAELDGAIRLLSESLPSLVELAEVEKSVELLALEIEKTRRRVNALEYVLIPKLRESAKYITMKLDEAERGNLTRLMKVKDIVRARGV